MLHKLKRFIFSFSKIKIVNLWIRGSYIILRPVLPGGIHKFFYKFPVNGKVKGQVEGAKPFIMVNNGSDSIANDIYWKGIYGYEKTTMKLILKLLSNSEVFFDIGANTGLYSLVAASLANEIKVHAFEPVDMAYNMIVAGKNASNFDNIKTNEIALSNFDGESTFNLQMSDESTIPLGSSLRQDMGDQQNKRTIKVKTFKLDTYVEKNGVTKIDLMKVDTEGTEDKVFEGGEYTITKFRPVIICEVLSNLIEDKLHSFMDNKNYTYYYVDENELQQCEKIIGDPNVVSNYLFVPEEKASLFLKDIKITKIKEKVFNN